MHESLKKLVPSRVRSVLKEALPSPLLTYYYCWCVDRTQEPTDWPLARSRDQHGIEKFEYSLFSQNGEDGILRYLYSTIGSKSKLFLEFGFGVLENNSLRLIMKENFGGIFIDGSMTSVRHFNNAARYLKLHHVRAIHQFLDLNNLEPTIKECRLPEEIDLLSIDVDGNDYWFWQGLNCLSPRVAVVEYNASLGPEASLTVPYDPTFDRRRFGACWFYHGASLTALQRLGERKGYGLVGCDSNGINAFFVREDCLTKDLTVLSPQSAYRPHKSRLARGFSAADQLRIIQDFPYINIE